MSILRALVSLFALVSLLSGCALNPATGDNDFVLITEQEELRQGQQHSQQIEQQYPLVKDQALQDYVQQVGDRIVKVSHRPHLNYRFRVIDTPDLNAFALPGGPIYIHRGLLAYLNSEAELAAVLAHEVGHVTARHSVQQQSMASAGGLLSAIAAAYTGVGAVGDLGNLANSALVRGYGRDHELEADGFGAQYLAQAGYDPKALIEMLELLQNHQSYSRQQALAEGRSVQSYHGLFSTHPSHDQRLQSVVATATTAGNGGRTGRDTYLRQIDGLAFGNSAEAGVVVKQNFYHKPLGFKVSLPQDWRIQNQPDALVAVAPNESAFLLLKPGKKANNLSPSEYLQKWLGQYQWDLERSISGRGLQGYTAQVYRGNQPPLRAAVIYHKDRVYQLLGSVKYTGSFNDYDPRLLSSVLSFGSLNRKEARLADGRQLKVIRVRSGQSYEKLANSSAIDFDAANQLRLLNDDWPAEQPKAGQRLKTVVW